MSAFIAHVTNNFSFENFAALAAFFEAMYNTMSSPTLSYPCAFSSTHKHRYQTHILVLYLIAASHVKLYDIPLELLNYVHYISVYALLGIYVYVCM